MLGCSSPSVSAATRSAVSDAERLDALGKRLVAEQSIEPLVKRSCQRQTQVLDLAAPHNLIRADAISGQQYDFSEPTNTRRTKQRAIFQRALRSSHVQSAVGIPSGTQVLGSIHSHVRRFK
jgi:hypothetical protein